MSRLITMNDFRVMGQRDQPFGFFIGPDGLGGWDDGVDLRRDAPDRPMAWGSFDTQGFPSSRVVDVPGTAVAETPKKLRQMKAAFTGLLVDGSAGRFTVNDDGDEQWAYGRLAPMKPTFLIDGQNQTTADFHIQFWMADPRKYGQTWSTPAPGTSFTIYHDGNAPAYPKYTVTGGSAGYAIWAYGLSYVVNSGIAGTHVIDMKTGLLSVGGVVQIGAASLRNTWTIPPGSFGIETHITGGAQMMVDLTDTSI